MTYSVPRADSLYNITYVINGKRTKVPAPSRQRAVGIARQLSTYSAVRRGIRILEITSADGYERYVGPDQAWLFVINNVAASRRHQTNVETSPRNVIQPAPWCWAH
jgi:hypothetical protein